MPKLGVCTPLGNPGSAADEFNKKIITISLQEEFCLGTYLPDSWTMSRLNTVKLYQLHRWFKI